MSMTSNQPTLTDRLARSDEDFMLEIIPDQAWNLALAGAPTIDIVRALRAYGRVDHGLAQAVQTAEKMRRMLEGRR